MVNLNLEFSELALQYLKTEDSNYIKKICSLKAADHIYFHAYNCNPEMNFKDKESFVKSILSKNSLKNNIINYENILTQLKNQNNLTKEAENETLKYLPEGTIFSVNMYITLGYFPVGMNGNFNIDLSFNFDNIREILYLAIHELHHVGFLQYHKVPLSINNLKSKGDLANLLSAHFQLEALATYAPYNIRLSENSLNDPDYCKINDIKLMNEYKRQLFASYDNLKKGSDLKLEENDFAILNDFWNGKRIAYRFGLYSCIKISEKYGQAFLVNTIKEGSDKFMDLVHLI